MNFVPANQVIDDKVLAQLLHQRGVRLDGIRPGAAQVRCTQCGRRWAVPLRRVLTPIDETTYWWCPNGCNHEE